MEFIIESVKFKPYHPQWEEFRQSKDQPIGRDLYRRGLRLQQLARVSVPHKTGRLAASIVVKYSRGLRNPNVTIGSSLRHAYWVHEGTRPHTIKANRDKLMRFVVKGRVVYIHDVHHPGTRATHYLSKHLKTVVR